MSVLSHPRRRRVRLLTAVGILATYLTTVGLQASPAQAAADDQTLSGTPSSMGQTNNTVRALAYSAGRLYAGGDFTAVRPAGAASGTSLTTRNRFAAFDASTGALVTAINANFNNSVYDIAISPDGTKLYAVGLFTTVNGVTRNRVAGFNLPAGTLITSFAPNVSSNVTSVAATNTTVYIGGDFSQVNGVNKARIASLNATSGALNTAFTAAVDNRINSMVMAPDGSRLLIGGSFTTINGGAPNKVGAVHATTGATMPWAMGASSPHTDNCEWNAKDIVVQGGIAYVAAEGAQPGCLDGTYAVNIADGTQVWASWCLGATAGLAIMNGLLYKASHMHDCGYDQGSRMGGFVGPQVPDDFFWWRLSAQSLSDGGWTHWSPNTNATTSTDPVGPRVMATDGTQLWVAGDFTTVNNANQQGITRFRPGGSAPLRPAAPTVTATAAGTLTVIVGTVEDRDSGTLTYALYRNSTGTGTPIATRTAVSYPWTKPSLRFDDAGLTPGANYSYTVRVTDGTNVSAFSPASAPVTVSGTEPADYPVDVLGDSPSSYWRLAGSGGTLADASPAAAEGITVGGVTTGVPGAIAGDNAVTLDGSTGYLASAVAAGAAPATFTQSAWFKTSTLKGGTIMALSDTQTGLNTLTDRVVFMDNNGQVEFGLRQALTGNRFTYVRSPNSYNDGQWHQVVATYDGVNITLYMDGGLAATLPAAHAGSTGTFLRAGYANLLNFDTVFGRNLTGRTAPNSFFFAGSLDEVATYPAALTTAQVRSQFITSVTSGPAVPPGPPVSDYAQSVLNDNPWMYWRLGDSSGAPATDSSGNGRNGTYRTGITYGAAGAIVGDANTAVTNPGTSGIAYTNASVAGPTTYSLETWVRTTSGSGGKLIGLENVQTGWGASYDRQLYLTNAGVVTYGIVVGGTRYTVAGPAVNNGAWHHLVATQDASGMKLYVDGALVASAATTSPDVYTGFWRVGGGNLTGWPSIPTSTAVAGTQDEAAVYTTALTPAQITAHYTAGIS